MEERISIYDMEEDNRKKRQLMLFYSLTFFGNGIYNSFFGTYEAMLETDIFMYPIFLVGIIEVLSQAVKWIFSPLLGAFMDRFSFKRGKFWPWMRIGVTLMLVSHVTIFAFPALVKNTTSAAAIGLVFVLQCITSFAAPMYTTSVNAVYPKISLDSRDRSIMAMGQKIGRDSSKTIFGLFIPVLIIFFSAKLGSQANAYAFLAVALGLMAFGPYLVLSGSLKNSYVERNAAAAEDTKTQTHSKAKITLKMIFQAIFTNRILLVIFIYMIVQQAYYFLIQMTSTYLFKYYFNAFQYYGIFTTAFNFPAVGGVIVGVIWRNYLKDLKKAFITAGIAHVAMLGITTLVFRSLTWWSFAALIGTAQFFAGMCEAYYLPMFGIAADWGALKSGRRQDGLIMSTYTMSISIGMNISTLLRTFLFAKVGYNAKLYVTGVKPTIEVLQMLANMNSLIPLILSALCVAIIAFFYNVNEEKHKEIIAQLKNIK